MTASKANFSPLKLKFSTSCPNVQKANAFSDRIEFAFAGKSNTGKSSLIGAISGQKGLVKTSATPGKTRLINYFAHRDLFYLVDLPGFGYAKLSKNARTALTGLIKGYLEKSKNLKTVFFLKDCRRKWDEEELFWFDLILKNGRDIVLVLTKVDKLKQSEKKKLVPYHTSTLGISKEQIYLTSTLKKSGLDRLVGCIDEATAFYHSQQAAEPDPAPQNDDNPEQMAGQNPANPGD